LTGKLESNGLSVAGKRVVLQYGYTSTGPWKDSAVDAETAGNGTFSLVAKPTRKTYYRAHFVGDADFLPSMSAVRSATPRVHIGAPKAPVTMYAKRAKTVYGYLKPRHTAKTYPVRIYKWKRLASGKWKSYGYVKAKASNYSTYTKYSASLQLPSKGTWRLRAYAPADSRHAATWSAKYDYVKVK
jgi:hypothetical protein